MLVINRLFDLYSIVAMRCVACVAIKLAAFPQLNHGKNKGFQLFLLFL